MLLKIALVVVFFSADGTGYKDFVGVFDTMAECQEARVGLIRQWMLTDSEGYVVSSCGKARALSAKDV